MNLIFKEATRPWTPDVLRGSSVGLAAWYDAADAKSVVLNGTNVSSWQDKSGNGRTAINNNASTQPAYNISAFNNKPALDWGSATNSKYLSCSSSFVPRLVFLVGQYTGGAGTFAANNAAFTFNDGGGSANGLLYLGGTGTANWSMGTAFHHINGVATGTRTAFPAIESPFIIRNGSMLPTISGGSYFIGIDRQIANRGWAGYIAEIIITTTVFEPALIYKMEGYLAWKWGTQASLAADHPYRYHRPMR